MIQFKKPKFWDLKKPNYISIALKPISIIIKNLVKIKYLISSKKTYSNIKLICVGNIYLGGTGKTSLCLKLYELLSKKYKCCFIKKYYKNQKDEQMLLENKDLILKELNNLSKSFKIFTSEYYPTNIDEFEKKKNYLAFSGIGNHKSFISMLKKYDLKIKKEIEFPDHYQFSPNDIKKILNTAEDENLEIITTEKDYLRLNNIDNKKINYVKSELKLDNENEFIKIILEDVNQI
jgi:tetraacyldisaccharide 4'-kinase